MWVIRHINDKWELGHYYQVGSAGKYDWIYLLRFVELTEAMRCLNYLNGGQGFPLNLKIRS